MFEGMSPRQVVELARSFANEREVDCDVAWRVTIKDSRGDNYTAIFYLDGERIIDACILNYFGHDITFNTSYRWP